MISRIELTKITNYYSCVNEESTITHLIRIIWQIKAFKEATKELSSDECLVIVEDAENKLSEKLLELISLDVGKFNQAA